MAEREIVPTADGDDELDALLRAADGAVLSALEGAMDLSHGLAAITGRGAAEAREVPSPASGSTGVHPDRHGRKKRQQTKEEPTYYGLTVNMASGDANVGIQYGPSPGAATEALAALAAGLEELGTHASTENASTIDGVKSDLAAVLGSQERTQLPRILAAIAVIAAAEGAKGAPVLDLVSTVIHELYGE